VSGVLESTVTQDVCIRGKMLDEWDFIEDYACVYRMKTAQKRR